MNIQEELILRYFEDSLTASDMASFQALMESDPAFKDAVEFQKKIKLAVRNQERKGLKEFLGQIEKDIPATQPAGQRPKSKSIQLWSYLVAATVVLAIAATYILKNAVLNSEEPYAQDFYAYYEPYPNVVEPITRGEEVNPEELEKAAFIAYENGSFEQADSLFSQLIYQRKEYIFFYRGIAKIELEQHDSAKMLFEKYIYSEGMQFRDQAKWYLALNYLIKGDSVRGKEELVKLRKSSGYKMEEVERILLNLE